jgi:D-alanyl-lipoteichoic acid acyltransferase DltB (MBOAT superfamily)
MNPTIDLTTPGFWVIALLAVALMTPITHGTLRRWVWAGVNVMFLAWMLHLRVLEVLAGLAVAHLALRMLADRGGNRRWRLLIAVCGLGVAVGLFVLHKLPDLSHELGMKTVNPLLLAVGFSYVFLRLIDAGRVIYQDARTPPDLPSTINYLVPLHMLAAGPIQSYEHFVDQPVIPKPVSAVEALGGFERIALGLFKKFVVAYYIRNEFLTGFYVDGPYFLFEVQMHYLWIYLDFSAYSDIAVGIGRLMGVHTPENFDKPYLARNMIDFWDRWHISLSQWVRRNLFIPIQLSLARRTGGKRALLIATLAFTVSFLLCGLWHGISWPFFAWGAMHALGLVVTNAYRYWLTKRLGRKGVKVYKEKLGYRMLAQFGTFQYVAFSLVVITYPWKDLWS